MKKERIIDTPASNIDSSGISTAKPAANQGRVLLIVAIALFAAFSAVRIYLATFPKTIDVMPDELRYLDLARSLFDNGSLTIRGELSDFQKILYPLTLFPALFFDDTITQVKAIGVLASLYACSAVFPAFLMAKRLFKNTKVIIACMVLTLIMPDMCYSMTFMSESLYLPLALWLIWLLWEALIAQGNRRIIFSLVGGVLCYATYLCKEVAATFAIAFVLLYVMIAVKNIDDRRECVMAIGCFIIGFFAPFVIMKLTLFGGLPNSYSQTSPAILLSPYTLLFTLYALAMDSAYWIVGFAFFPIFFVAFTYRDLSCEDKRLFLLSLIALTVSFLTIVYTISIREDVGHEALRQHMRYVAPLFIPLLFLFIKQIAQADTASLKRSPRRLAGMVGITAVVVMLVAFFLGTANLEQGFDNSQFHLLRWFCALFTSMSTQYFDATFSTMSAISTGDGTLLTINPGVWLARLLVIAGIVGGMIALLGKHRKTTGIVIVAVIAALLIANNVVNVQYNMKAYALDESQADETAAIDAYLEQLPAASEVLIVNDSKNTGANNLTDTYIDNRRLTYRYITADNLAAYLSDTGVLDQNGVLYRTGSSLNNTDYYGSMLPHIEYVLVNTSQKISFLSSNVEEVNLGNRINFRLYHITDNQPVAVAQS